MMRGPLQVEVNPQKRPHVTEMGRFLRRFKKKNVTEHVKVEW